MRARFTFAHERPRYNHFVSKFYDAGCTCKWKGGHKIIAEEFTYRLARVYVIFYISFICLQQLNGLTKDKKCYWNNFKALWWKSSHFKVKVKTTIRASQMTSVCLHADILHIRWLAIILQMKWHSIVCKQTSCKQNKSFFLNCPFFF